MIQQAIIQGIKASKFVTIVFAGCIIIPANAHNVNDTLVLFLLLNFIFQIIFVDVICFNGVSDMYNHGIIL